MSTQPKAHAIYQNDPFLPQRDVVISVLLRQLKDISERLADVESAKKGMIQDLTYMTKRLADVENANKEMTHDLSTLKLSEQRSIDTSKRLAETNVMLENVKKEMAQDLSNLKNELAQMKKQAEGSKSQPNGNGQNLDDIQTQADLLATPFQNATIDSGDEATASARFCNCRRLTSVTDTLSKDMAEQKSKLKDLTAKIDAATSTTPASSTSSSTSTTSTTPATSYVSKTNGKMPSSCADLVKLGYQQNGIFSIMGNKEVESVYCDFTKASSDEDFQKKIGIVNRKTTRVSFHAQRSTAFKQPGTVSFELLGTNEGKAMTESGIFTAPTPGTYSFALSGVGLASVLINLEKMGATEAAWSNVGQTSGMAGTLIPVSLRSTLRLNKGDQIRLNLVDGIIADVPEHRTNFVGFLLDEDL
ncbi:rho GTPase-activating protein gacN-like [Daphnia carinata]|uniref:rho GTPase-activating protein gacN-like n=1 Tax=Daphnia carinata TaxID=120202 RepID=UPI0028687086|nr:rho GTPase-activating protein gacN-like [Daphnia carinata]